MSAYFSEKSYPTARVNSKKGKVPQQRGTDQRGVNSLRKRKIEDQKIGNGVGGWKKKGWFVGKVFCDITIP